MTEMKGKYVVDEIAKPELIDFEVMLSARFPLIYVVSAEEETIEVQLTAIAQKRKTQIYFWDFARGWSEKDNADKGNVMAALARVAKSPSDQATIFVMKDISTLIAPGVNGQITASQLPLVRELKNLSREMSHDRRCVILLSDQLRLPIELREETTVVDNPLPNLEEIEQLVECLVGKKLKVAGLEKEQLFKACQGLTQYRIRRILAHCLAKSGKIDELSINTVIEEKRSYIRETGILEFIPAQNGLESIGGLDNLKAWVRMRSHSFSDKARNYGLSAPKGILLAGIQGTGKSLSAKIIATEWKLPLLRLDVGRLFGGIVGESESRIRQVVKLAEAIAPCVLWIDEVDKAFANIANGSGGDSGTSQRVFGTLLTWMQEKTAPVFLVLTANNVEILPAEFLRKGRLDEIFFVHLPNHVEREQIFKVHLLRLRPDRIEEFSLKLLANHTKDLSGAEIEQVIYEAMHTGFSRGEEFSQDDLINAICESVPLARIAQAQIEALKAWAVRSGARNASEIVELISLTTLSPLEID